MTNLSWLNNQIKNLSVRDAGLMTTAYSILMNNIHLGEHYPITGVRCISPSRVKFPGVWNWDSAFIGRTVSRWDIELAKEQFELFFNAQSDSGQFPDVIFFDGKINDTYTKPPVFAWAMVDVYKRCGDRDFLVKGYESYKLNEQWWYNCRRARGDELFFYDCNNPGCEEARKYIGWESGWDDSVRWDDYPSDLWAIDLNCYMVMFYRALKFMAQELNLDDESKAWDIKETRLTELINSVMYNKSIGAYTDVNRFTGKYTGVLTPASFMPLYIGIAPNEYAESMNKIATEHFLPGMPTVAYTDFRYDSRTYWRGPTWLNVAYFAAKGLSNYGYNNTADTIKETILDWCSKYDTLYENYDSKTGEGLYGSEFSWSGVFVIEFILENFKD